MTHETTLDIVTELGDLLEKENRQDHSISLEILSNLRTSLVVSSSSSGVDDGDYTRSRAQALSSLALKMKSLLSASCGAEMTYADKAKTLAVVSDSYLKLAHAFKTDPKMWALAQTELVPALTHLTDEDGVDSAFSLLKSHLEIYLVSLGSWLGK